MNIDLNAMSHKDLMQLKADVEAAIKHAQIRDRREALEAAEKAAAKYGFSLDELSMSGKLKNPKQSPSRNTSTLTTCSRRGPAKAVSPSGMSKQSKAENNPQISKSETLLSPV